MHPSTPKYVQLIEIIKDAIQKRELLPQAQLPNEDELAIQYGMSRGTVRKAIAELQRTGLVRKEQGRGTFINEQKPTLSNFSLVEFDQYVKAQNRVPSTETLAFKTLSATGSLIEKLNVPTNTEVIYIAQMRFSSGLPIVYEERYFVKSFCPDLSVDMLNEHTLHWLLVEKYQIPLVRLSHTIELSNLTQDMFKQFKVTEPVSIFQVDRLSYTRLQDEIVPAVWYQALYRADEYQFHTQFRTSI